MKPAIIVVALAISPAFTYAESRTWTDSTGKYETEAEFVSLEAGKVTLKRTSDGKVLVLSLERLSEADQKVAQALAGKPKATSQKPNNIINSVRGAVYRNETLQNIRQIGLSLISYESTRGHFPTASIKTKDGKPGLSWRVAILPFIEENNLYKQFHLDEPWDSSHNIELVDRMPKVFRSPGTAAPEGYTNYLAIRGDDSVIAEARRGSRMRDIRDGTSNTVMVVEVDDDHSAIWTKPDDYQWDTENPLSGLGEIWTGRFFAAFADGSSKQIPISTPLKDIRALFTRNGGEPVRLDF